ncbi:MAG: ImmA/IrrE family metallo-endopeptidase [Oscillospiraceae bacterium]|jgi:hypothetical protein
MRRLWECSDWNTFLENNRRKGVRLRFDKDVDDEVRRASKEFVNWLRRRYDFPMRVPIYFKASRTIRSLDGEEVSATFFGPYDKTLEPYIRIAVGDYKDLLDERGKDNALGAILHSVAHELSHYFQWIKDYNFLEERCERQARYYASEILYDYAEVREHP